MFGGPPKRGAQIGQLDGEPGVRLALPGAIPQGHDVGFASGEVPRVGGPNLGCFASGDEFLLGDLADGLHHRKAGPPRRPVGDQQRLAYQRVQQIQHGVVIDLIETSYCTGALDVEATREH